MILTPQMLRDKLAFTGPLTAKELAAKIGVTSVRDCVLFINTLSRAVEMKFVSTNAYDIYKQGEMNSKTKILYASNWMADA